MATEPVKAVAVPSPTKVWGVTRGSYSDYRVQALFASRTDAQRHMDEAREIASGDDDDLWNHPDNIEEFLLYPKGGEPRIVTVYNQQAVIWDDGSVTDKRSWTRREWEYDPLYQPVKPRPNVRFVRAPVYKGKGGRLEASGSNERAVRQAFSDNLAQRRALPTVQESV